jgi:5-methylcytosine-specific restriction endonuclease McrA
MHQKFEKPVLVLNKNYNVIGTSPLYKALNLLFTTDSEGKPKAVVIDESCMPHTWEQWSKFKIVDGEQAIYTIKHAYRIPEVIKLNRYDRMPRQTVLFSRANIFKRDEYTCQYCGIKPGSEELTIDHVIPKARGGKTTWNNCVLSCISCNSIKGSFFCNEVTNSKFPKGMKLLKTPFQPKLKDFKVPIIYQSWKQWLNEAYWLVELENQNHE